MDAFILHSLDLLPERRCRAARPTEEVADFGRQLLGQVRSSILVLDSDPDSTLVAVTMPLVPRWNSTGIDADRALVRDGFSWRRAQIVRLFERYFGVDGALVDQRLQVLGFEKGQLVEHARTSRQSVKIFTV